MSGQHQPPSALSLWKDPRVTTEDAVQSVAGKFISIHEKEDYRLPERYRHNGREK
jgi:hypothetical protein